jgi:hypothetical protein
MPGGNCWPSIRFGTSVVVIIMKKGKGKWPIVDGHNTSITKKAIDPAKALSK